MADEELLVDGRALSSLKVADLKEELENRGLSTKGVKAVLQDRLREALAGKQSEPDGQNPIVAGYLARQEAALAEARKRTESEASGTGTPQSESPVKASSSRKSTPRKSRKVSEIDPGLELQNMEDNQEKPDEESIAKVPVVLPVETELVESATTKNPADSTGEQKTENTTVTAPHEAKEHEIKLVEAKQESDEEKEIVIEKPSEQRKDTEESDELDYGDDDEKDIKDDSMEDEDAKKEEEEVVVGKKIEENEKSSSVKKEEKVRESVSHRRASSPSSRHPVSSILHIRGLTRPFTEKSLRDLLEKHGGEIKDFWIDKVKSHCFAKFNAESDAINVRKQLNDITWPDGNPKKLAIVFETEESMNNYKEGRGEVKLPDVVSIGTLTGASRTSRLSSTSQSSVLTGKANFQITLQNAVRDNDKKEVERKEKRGSLASRLTRLDDKEKEKPKDDERKRKRSETPPFSRGAGFMDEKKAKQEEGRSEKKREESRRGRYSSENNIVVEEEPLKVSMEQIFKKTVTLPSIYYLPLTDEEVAAKSAAKASENEKERSEKPERPSERSADRSNRDHANRDRDRRVGDRGEDKDRPRRRD